MHLCMRTTIDLDDDLAIRAKKEAIERAGSFTSFIEKNKSEIEAAIDVKTSENQFKKLQKLEKMLILLY